jgi:hypothetical protein
MNKERLYEIIGAGIIAAAGVGTGLYSLNLRDMAERQLINYSYMQGVGIHWGLGAAEGAFMSLATRNPLYAAVSAGMIGVVSEILQYITQGSSTTYMGRGTIEDAVGQIGGAIIGAYGPILVSKAASSLEKIVFEKSGSLE